MFVILVICELVEGVVVLVNDGEILFKGYVWSGGGKGVVWVDVLLDGGKIWYVVNLDGEDKFYWVWVWKLWNVILFLLEGKDVL